MAVGDSPMVDPTAPPAPLPRQQWSVHHESIVAACRDQFDPDITRKPPTSGPVDRGITTATVPPRPAGGAIVSGTGSMTTLLTKSELHARRRDTTAAKQSVSYANTNPLWIVRGSGQYLYDEQNLRYLDTRNNVAHVGHCHPTVVEAITAQAGLLNTNTRYLHENLVTFATELLETFGPQNTHEMRKVFVVNSGSEANDLALRLIEAYHQKHSRRRRDDTVVVDHGYHGHTKSVVDISPYKWVEQKSHIHVIPAPKGEEGSKQSLAVLENILERDVADAAAASLLASPGDEEDGKNAGAATSRKVGAMFIESGMSVAGVLIPHADYLNRAASLIRNHGGLFVADEVGGFPKSWRSLRGRRGRWFRRPAGGDNSSTMFRKNSGGKIPDGERPPSAPCSSKNNHENELFRKTQQISCPRRTSYMHTTSSGEKCLSPLSRYRLVSADSATGGGDSKWRMVWFRIS